MSEEATKHVIRQLTEALAHLHDDKNVMHRDIKTSNILIKWKNMSDKISCQSYEFCSHHHNPFEMQIKLGDFGFAKSV